MALGSLNELVYEPTDRLLHVFEKWARVSLIHVEVAEFEQMENARNGCGHRPVKQQVKDMYRCGYEIATAPASAVVQRPV